MDKLPTGLLSAEKTTGPVLSADHPVLQIFGVLHASIQVQNFFSLQRCTVHTLAIRSDAFCRAPTPVSASHLHE
eukprot:2337448-Pleurochrysis_carterae.AAC.1